MKKDRTPKNKTTEVNILEPLNIELLGSKDDPCFGKHFSLKADECKRCGDSEVCHVLYSNKATKIRREMEVNKAFMDIIEPETPGEELLQEEPIVKFLKAKKRKGWKDLKIILKAKKKFNLPKDKIKELLIKIK